MVESQEFVERSWKWKNRCREKLRRERALEKNEFSAIIWLFIGKIILRQKVYYAHSLIP